MIRRAFRYRLYPTKAQELALEETANARRFVYNLALEQRRDFWRQAKAHGVTLNFASQGRELTALRRECAWLRDVSAVALHQALRDLDRAFSEFFAGRARFPKFQSKRGPPRFRIQAVAATIRIRRERCATINVPKVGQIRLRLTRSLKGRAVRATFTRDALGWHVSVLCEIEHEAPANDLPAIGIDRGIANTLALSNGEMLSTPDVSRLDRRKRKAQRTLSRRQRGSARYRKQRQQVARLAAKMARIRAEWQHRASTDIARRFRAVAIEDLKASNMVRANSGLARAIHEQGWHGFASKLAYKLEERGGTLLKVNPAHTSQECSCCGAIDKRSRESQARFACRHCGFTDHADTNAAKNILRRSSAVVEGRGCAPVEARTDHALAA